MTVLALETSCDETAVAILRGDGSGHELLASEVASQVAAHEKYGGIVPEIASRNHLIYAPRLLDRAASAAKIRLVRNRCVRCHQRPGSGEFVDDRCVNCERIGDRLRQTVPRDQSSRRTFALAFFRRRKRWRQRYQPNVSLIVSGGTHHAGRCSRPDELQSSAAQLTMLRAKHSTK